MKKYTIGIIFNSTLDKVVLIKKERPDWQKGRYNFPGGHIEENETPAECVAREIKEECDLNIPWAKWDHIGQIFNKDANYSLEMFATIIDEESYGQVKTMTDEEVGWFDVNALPVRVISNLKWITPFARNYMVQGNADKLHFGTFEYKNQ